MSYSYDFHLFLLVALNVSLDALGEYFRIHTNLLGISDRIYESMNETSYTIGFCAIRCEADGAPACTFFLFENGTCYLGNWGKDVYSAVAFEFDYATVYYRESE